LTLTVYVVLYLTEKYARAM